MEANKIQIEYSSFENQFQCIHENKSDGYITIASKNNKYKQRHYAAAQILKEKENIIEKSNSYISQNTFYRP